MKSRILVVEDEDYIVDVIVVALEQEGYEVESAVNGKEALDLLQKSPFDLVICDIIMPVMNGFELVDEMKNDSRLMSIPIIFLTGQKSEESQILGRLKGGDDYLTKPFDIELLLGSVKARLKWAEKYRELGNAVVDNIRDRLLTSLSDQFRNPLMSISGSSESLQAQLGDMDNEEVRRFLAIISEQTQRLGQLVEDFLSFAEFELTFDDPRKTTKLIDTVDQCVLANTGEISRKNVSIIRKYPKAEILLNVPTRPVLRILDRVMQKQLFYARDGDYITLEPKLVGGEMNQAKMSFVLDHKMNVNSQGSSPPQGKNRMADFSGLQVEEVDLFVVRRMVQKCEGNLEILNEPTRRTIQIILPSLQ